MVIINDNPKVKYWCKIKKIRILNTNTRFNSISDKIEWGYKQCKHDYIYRLDDDDLLAPFALQNVVNDIIENPGYDVYRSSGMYLFQDNKFVQKSSNINNGNVYTKSYLDRIKFPGNSGCEDVDITFNRGAKIYESTRDYTMIYRWGMNTFHISGIGLQPNEVVLKQADRLLDNEYGEIELNPQFSCDYYSQIIK